MVLTIRRAGLSDARLYYDSLRDGDEMTLEAVKWLTGISVFALVARAIYLYIEWRWRARVIRANDRWFAQREQDRRRTLIDDDRAA